MIALDAAQGPSPALAILIPAASVAILLVVRERVERERNALRQTALTDPLTGLANRRSLLSRIDYEIARHTRSRGTFALIMLDLDGFKQLNDRFGHPTGDDLLRDVAIALKRAVRDQDTVARIGGDEFCVLAPETDEPRHATGSCRGSPARWPGSPPGSTRSASARAPPPSRMTARRSRRFSRPPTIACTTPSAASPASGGAQPD